MLPVIASIDDHPQYLDNPIVRKYGDDFGRMAAAAADGHNLGWETPLHRVNVHAGKIVNSGLLAEMVQRVVLNDETPRAALADTARKIEALVGA